MRKFLIFSLLAGIFGALAACQDKASVSESVTIPGADTVKIELSLERLDTSLLACTSEQAVKFWLDQHADFTAYYFPKGEFQDKQQLVKELFRRINDPNLREFYKQVKESFGDLDPLKEQVITGLRNIKAYDPTFRVPKIKTIFTGFMGADLIISDSMIVIGLDYFLGPKAKYRPQVYDYQLWRYTPQALVPQMIFVISERYSETNRQDQTLLADMIGYGKGFEFTQTMLPKTPDSLIIGYTDKQLAETAIAQDLVWSYLIENKLLYETNPNKKVKYLGDRPVTPEIGPRCPGSIGRWVGWQIIRYYRKNNPDRSLKDIMQQTNTQQLLEASKYRGQTEEE
ncbi:MAG: gliding motility protein [Siphonobacter sp.]